MADTNDTIDGLLAEFRGYAAGMPPSYHVTMSWHDFRQMLDRLEAAHKRERGDAAKLREALAAYLALWDNGTMNNLDELKRVIKQMREALSAPPRNCDVSKVVEDPWRAWLDDKSNWDEFGSPKLEIHEWLFAPATEKEGGNDGNE